MTKRKHSLYQADDAGRGLEMAEIRLNRADAGTGPNADEALPMVSTIASTSIGSPSAVPVPCASKNPIRSGSTWADASASRISATWAGPFGAVSRVDRPS